MRAGGGQEGDPRTGAASSHRVRTVVRLGDPATQLLVITQGEPVAMRVREPVNSASSATSAVPLAS